MQGLAAGDVILLIQSADDRGFAGAFEFQVVKAVSVDDSSIQLLTPVSHDFFSGAETLWHQVGDNMAGACLDAEGGHYAYSNMVNVDGSLILCMSYCEAASQCIGVQFVASESGGCVLLALSGTDPDDFERQTGLDLDSWTDPSDLGLPLGSLPIASTMHIQGVDATEWSSSADCWAIRGDPSSLSQSSGVSVTPCGGTGVCDIFGHAADLLTFVGSAVLGVELGTTDTVLSVPSEQPSYFRTTTRFSRPLRVDLTASGSNSECIVFQVFPQFEERHTGYSFGGGWWRDCFGTGIASDIECSEHNFDVTQQHTYSIELTTTHVRFILDGRVVRQVADTTFTSGVIGGGFNLVDAQITAFTVSKEVLEEDDATIAVGEAGCAYDLDPCVCSLRCPIGMHRFGDGSACHGEGHDDCDLGYCHDNPNSLPPCALPDENHVMLATRSAQVVKVPQFTSLHVLNGGSITSAPWDGRKGGAAVVMASGPITVDGSITADATGFRGGAMHNDNSDGSEGETFRGFGPGVASWHASFGGGGGGQFRIWSGADTIGASGGGGGHATEGGDGTHCQDPTTTGAYGGEGGGTYGRPSLDRFTFGSGGGAAADEDRNTGSPAGGAGGGLVLLHTPDAVVITGSISADGESGFSTPVEYDSGVGGGGAGGSILITASSIAIGAPTEQPAWYSGTTNPAWAGASWQAAVDFCTSEGKELCRYEDYCPEGASSPPIGGTKTGDRWSPYLGGGTENKWVQVGVWSSDATTTCTGHHQINDGYYGDPVWGTDDNRYDFQEFVLCCPSTVAVEPLVHANGGTGGETSNWCGQQAGGDGGDGFIRLSADTIVAADGIVQPTAFEESIAAGGNDGCSEYVDAGMVFTGVGLKRPTAFDAFDRFGSTSFENCQDACAAGVLGCGESCSTSTRPLAADPCDQCLQCNALSWSGVERECTIYADVEFEELNDSCTQDECSACGCDCDCPCTNCDCGSRLSSCGENALRSCCVGKNPGLEFFEVEAAAEPLYVGTAMNMEWEAARDFCRQNYYDLASVHCAEQQELAASACTSAACWIGLSDIASEGNFQWSDSSPFDYEYFAPGEPDDNSRDAEEDFVGCVLASCTCMCGVFSPLLGINCRFWFADLFDHSL